MRGGVHVPEQPEVPGSAHTAFTRRFREILGVGRPALSETSAAARRLSEPCGHVLAACQHVQQVAVGNGLHELADARVVPPSEILRVGLTILSMLAELCKSNSRASRLRCGDS
jgi:hypothetical protein